MRLICYFLITFFCVSLLHCSPSSTAGDATSSDDSEDEFFDAEEEIPNDLPNNLPPVNVHEVSSSGEDKSTDDGSEDPNSPGATSDTLEFGTSDKDHQFTPEEMFLFERLNASRPSPVGFTWSADAYVGSNQGFHFRQGEKFLADLLNSFRIEDIFRAFNGKILPGMKVDRHVRRIRKAESLKMKLFLDSIRVKDILFRPLPPSAYKNARNEFHNEAPYSFINNDIYTEERLNVSKTIPKEVDECSRLTGDPDEADLPLKESILKLFNDEEIETLVKDQQKLIFMEDQYLNIALRGLNLKVTMGFSFAGIDGHAWLRLLNGYVLFRYKLGKDKITGKPRLIPVIKSGETGAIFGDIKVRFMDRYGRPRPILSRLGNFACDRFAWTFVNSVADTIQMEVADLMENVIDKFASEVQSSLEDLMFSGEEYEIIPYLLVKNLMWKITDKNIVISFYLRTLSENERENFLQRYELWFKSSFNVPKTPLVKAEEYMII